MLLRQKFYCVLLVVMAIVYATGCAKKADPVRVQYYPGCHEPLAYLQQRGSGAGSAAAGGAIQGGVISGIASAIVGAITGGINGVGMAVGVGVGASLGGTMGAIGSASEQQREDNKHLAAYLEQIDGDIEGLDIVSAAATVSRQCYNREFVHLLAGMRDKSITGAAARGRFDEIMAGEEETAKLLGRSADTARLQAEFDEAARGDK